MSIPLDRLLPRDTLLSVSQGFIVFDSSGRLLSCNERARALLDLPSEATTRGTPYAKINRWLQSAGGSSSTSVSLSKEGDGEPLCHMSWSRSERADGSVVLWARAPLPSLGFGIVVMEGTPQYEREVERRLYASLAQRIATAEDFDHAARAVLRILCRHGGWQYGEAWVPDKRRLWLEPGPRWSATQEIATAFDPRFGGHPALRLGEGFAGDIWRTQRPHVIADLAQASDGDYSRRRQAVAAGLPAVLGVPIKIRDEVFAVCVFNTHVVTPRARRMIELVAGVAPQLYALLRVKVANDAASAHQNRVAELFDAVGEAIITVDAAQNIAGFNREAERLCGYSADEVVGQPLDILLPEESTATHRALVDTFGRGTGARKFMGGRPAIRGRRKDGSEFIAEASITRSEINGEVVFTAALRDVTELKQAEANLRASEKRFQDIAEIASDIIWELDSSLRFTYLSGGRYEKDHQLIRDICGKTPWEAAGASPASEALWARCRADLEAHRAFRNFQYSVISRDGKTHYFRVSGSPIFDQNGSFIGYRGTTTDETETLSALVRAREAEELLRSAIDSISEGFIIFDKNDRVVMRNQAYRDLFPEGAGPVTRDTTFEDITRGALRRGLYANVSGREEAWVQERLRRHREASGSIEQWRTDGRVYLVTERRMPDGGTAGLRTDITALKRAEAALRESQHLLQTTFETITEGVVVFDSTLRIAALNRNLFTLLGVMPEALKVGDSVEKMVRLCFSTSAVENEALDHCVGQELARLRKFTPQVAERSLRNGNVLEIQDDPLPGGGVVRTYRDITMRKRVENELRSAVFHAQKASEAKSDFMAAMSHELRTPLNAIIGFSEIMEHAMFGPLGNERYLAYARDIHQSGSHLLAIINDILDYAKFESGRQPLAEEELELVPLINETIDALRLQAEREEIALSFEPGEWSPRVLADERKLKQILMNLISNAVKFTQPSGRVTVSYSADPQIGLRLTVKDTGIGMGPEEIPIALEPFRQLDGRLNRKYSGTGLGLPLTKRLVELHGGTFSIESVRGEGTVVTITLPQQRIVGRSELHSPSMLSAQMELDIGEGHRRSSARGISSTS